MTRFELWSLIIAALTPLAVVCLGLLVARSARRVEHLQHANQMVVGRRIEVFAEVALKLNLLLCFATFVGRWKEIRPNDALALKREIDQLMYANRLIFSDQLFDAYRAFMACLFAMYANVDHDAPIRAKISSSFGDRRKLPWWDPAMEEQFNTDDTTSPEEAWNVYERLTAAFRSDLYVTKLSSPVL